MVTPELPEHCNAFNLYFGQLRDFYVVNYNYILIITTYCMDESQIFLLILHNTSYEI